MDIETFANPPADCRPQTRWWWLGNVLTPEEISWQLREMHAQGIRGVEQLSFEPEYEKGNIAYSSDEFFARLKHTITEAHTLDMTVSVNFGGPGWIWGGDWVPEDERTQCMLSSSFIVNGPARIDQALSKDATQNPRDIPRSYPKIEPEDKLIAVVVGKVVDGVIDAESLRDVSEQVHDRQITWDAPEGTWRVMAFWSTNPESSNAVNHIDKSAMTRYVETLGGKFTAALGEPLGASIESLFGDSFEVPVHRNGMYWADRVPEEFRARKGYNLVPNLPALWWDIGVTTPKVRYDVNDVLHQMGMEAFYDTFGAWCKAQGVKTRVQPYGFVTDVLEGARDSDIPEMEITAGEKDAVPWFDTRVGPREYVASGAHIYGRNIVSVEADTYLHW